VRFTKIGKFNPPTLILEPASRFVKKKQAKTLTTGVSRMLKAMDDTTFKLKIDYGIGKGMLRTIVALYSRHTAFIQPFVSSLSRNPSH
jgi:hypothetical protein